MTDVPARPSARPGVFRVLIVDDHGTFAELLAMALNTERDFRCVGTAADSATALQLVERLRPDLVVMDIQLGTENGLSVAGRIAELVPSARLVVVSAHRDAAWVARAAKAGAVAFAPKSGSLEEMLEVLRSAVGARTPLERPLPDRAGDGLTVRLTDREWEVLQLMGLGIGPPEIARRLEITVSTCRGYVKAIHAKLEVRSQLEAVVKAQRLGLLGMADDDRPETA